MLRQITNVHNLKLDRKNFSDLHVLNAEHYEQLCNKTNMSTKSELATEITSLFTAENGNGKHTCNLHPLETRRN